LPCAYFYPCGILQSWQNNNDGNVTIRQLFTRHEEHAMWREVTRGHKREKLKQVKSDCLRIQH
jgi:hypothetical protein